MVHIGAKFEVEFEDWLRFENQKQEEHSRKKAIVRVKSWKQDHRT